jgi:hypothetical protein
MKGEYAMAQRIGDAGKLLTGLWMAGVTIATFVIIPPYQGLATRGVL